MSAGGREQQQKSGSYTDTFVFGGQTPFLTDLWSSASNLANGGQGAADAAQGALGVVNPFMQGGMDVLSGLTDARGQIEAQTASLQEGLSNMWTNTIMPGIESNSMLAGGLGGGRQGVAQGVASGEMASAFQQGYGDIVANANAQALNAANFMPTMGSAYFDMNTGAANAGMDQLGLLAQILGSPTILQKSRQRSKGESSGFDFGL